MKTKTMSHFFQALNTKRAIVAVTHEEGAKVAGVRNLPMVKVLNVEYLNPHDLLKYEDLLFTKDSLAHLYTHFA